MRSPRTLTLLDIIWLIKAGINSNKLSAYCAVILYLASLDVILARIALLLAPADLTATVAARWKNSGLVVLTALAVITNRRATVGLALRTNSINFLLLARPRERYCKRPNLDLR